MRPDKTMSMREAVASFVRDGDTVALEGFTHLIPTAAGHEIIRQGRRNLTVVRMTADIVVDQLLAGGCVTRLVSSFVGNSSAGSLGELRRRVEHADPEPLAFEEYSHHGMICRYLAGAQRLPFYPLRSYAGSDLPSVNPAIRKVASPYSEEQIYVVPPVNPDVTIVHAQRADRAGNTQIWGLTGIQAEAVFAAEKAVVVVEEVVDDEVVRSDPNRTVIPAHAVDAVVECPRGAHPSFAQGYYDRDGAFYRAWSGISKDPGRLREWMAEWIFGTADHAEYVAKLGERFWAGLAVGEAMSLPVNYGRRL
ncbi:glutaconate CoA-transferase subunit A [Amycolatopsis bartoniae]|uniref:3-oxoadipate--succinyl-CoA transferase subunit A n=1 Tax=Amycolatopsis bartoniae TaxID=941986 RepID=A0A8H9M7L1_9PSEU|nr:CoA-transferase [Amycolatopsis bartoniae]MBB2938345.1 glutaconate CoA-transferase subunit A [Amycolatopsis bartoniae]TVT01807.1 CoA transferase subunit A [Amycolatopsis bartoniae]GHF34496.1 3-oxoadipate--succinyl-CoA transferase subunit A [Amycolatopsis bartoniae]